MAQYSMKEAINKMLEESHWKSRYNAAKLKQDWELLMGKTVARHTDEIKLYEGVLTIYSTVAPLKNELSYNKILLIAKINQYFGEEVVKSIKIV